MKKILLILVLFPHVFLCFSCDCFSLTLDSLQRKYFKSSDIVFLGEIVKVDSANLNVVFQIYETFKGKRESGFISVSENSSSCSFSPIGNGLWLVYGKYFNDSLILVSTCSPTRSNVNPIMVSMNIFPDILTRVNRKKLEEQRFQYILKREEAIVEWYNELYKLRNGLIK